MEYSEKLYGKKLDEQLPKEGCWAGGRKGRRQI